MCSGPVSGASTSDDPSRMPTRLRSPLPSAECGGCLGALENDLLGVQLARRSAADQHRLQTEIVTRARRRLRPSAREANPSAACSSRRRSTPTADRIVAKNACCHARSCVPRPEVPHDRPERNAERREKLEVLVLDVLRRVRRNAVRREQPIEVARARAIEAELHGGARESRDDARLEVDLQVDHEIERARGELSPDVGERAQPFGAVEDDDLVDRPVAADERRGAGLQNPGDVNVGRVPLQRVDHRQHVHRVAHRAHHDDADAAKGYVDHGAEVTTKGVDLAKRSSPR